LVAKASASSKSLHEFAQKLGNLGHSIPHMLAAYVVGLDNGLKFVPHFPLNTFAIPFDTLNE
jgi:hypothetical protein